MPVYDGVAAVRSCQSRRRRADPLARFSFSSPLRDRERQRVDVQAERLIPEASTPSQLFVPCVNLHEAASVAPAEPIPPALTEVSNVSESACAPVTDLRLVGAARHGDLCRGRGLPVPVAVKTPGERDRRGAGDVEARARRSTSIVVEIDPGVAAAWPQSGRASRASSRRPRSRGSASARRWSRRSSSGSTFRRERDPRGVDTEPALRALRQLAPGLRVAPAEPTPPALTDVSNVSESAWAPCRPASGRRRLSRSRCRGRVTRCRWR